VNIEHLIEEFTTADGGTFAPEDPYAE